MTFSGSLQGPAEGDVDQLTGGERGALDLVRLQLQHLDRLVAAVHRQGHGRARATGDLGKFLDDVVIHRVAVDDEDGVADAQAEVAEVHVGLPRPEIDPARLAQVLLAGEAQLVRVLVVDRQHVPLVRLARQGAIEREEHTEGRHQRVDHHVTTHGPRRSRRRLGGHRGCDLRRVARVLVRRDRPQRDRRARRDLRLLLGVTRHHLRVVHPPGDEEGGDAHSQHQRYRHRAQQHATAPLRAHQAGHRPQEIGIVGRIGERPVVVTGRGEHVLLAPGGGGQGAQTLHQPRLVLLGVAFGIVEPCLELDPRRPLSGTRDARELRLHRRGHLPRRGEAIARRVRQGAIDQRAPPLAHRRPLPLRRRIEPLEHAPQHLRRVVPPEGERADDALVQEHTGGEDVGALVDLSPFDLLRRHVRRAPQHLPGGGHPLRIQQLGDAEVGQLHHRARPRLRRPFGPLSAVGTQRAR
jgi:hypothetical protein